MGKLDEAIKNQFKINESYHVDENFVDRYFNGLYDLALDNIWGFLDSKNPNLITEFMKAIQSGKRF